MPISVPASFIAVSLPRDAATGVAWGVPDEPEARGERRAAGSPCRRPAGAAPAHAALPVRLRRDRRLGPRRRRALRRRAAHRGLLARPAASTTPRGDLSAARPSAIVAAPW